MLHVLQTKKRKEVKKVDHSQQQEDYYRTKWVTFSFMIFFCSCW
jgi:hypothetical protein